MFRIKTAYCFDLDGTLTKNEILPLISQKLGIYDEIEALTKATIQGVIPFESSFKLRCRLLKDAKDKDIIKALDKVKLYLEIIDFIKEKPEDCYIITGNLNVWVEKLIDRIGCNYYSSRGLLNEEGKLQDIEKILDKSEAINDLRESKKYERIIAVGDGMGDVSMFQKADVSIAFGQTHDPVKSLIEVSDYIVFEEKSLCYLLKTL